MREVALRASDLNSMSKIKLPSFSPLRSVVLTRNGHEIR